MVIGGIVVAFNFLLYFYIYDGSFSLLSDRPSRDQTDKAQKSTQDLGKKFSNLGDKFNKERFLFFFSAKFSFKIEGEIKTFHDKH
jgi:hypothetical protein